MKRLISFTALLFLVVSLGHAQSRPNLAPVAPDDHAGAVTLLLPQASSVMATSTDGSQVTNVKLAAGSILWITTNDEDATVTAYADSDIRTFLGDFSVFVLQPESIVDLASALRPDNAKLILHMYDVELQVRPL